MSAQTSSLQPRASLLGLEPTGTHSPRFLDLYQTVVQFRFTLYLQAIVLFLDIPQPTKVKELCKGQIFWNSTRLIIMEEAKEGRNSQYNLLPLEWVIREWERPAHVKSGLEVCPLPKAAQEHTVNNYRNSQLPALGLPSAASFRPA